MLSKIRRSLCYYIMCVLLMAGMYTTYVKADSLAERAASIETAKVSVSQKRASATQLRGADRNVQTEVCVVERINPVIRAIIGRVGNRNSSIRRDLRFAGIYLWALCVAIFLLQCCLREESLWLYEEKYRAALIKYIHDIDGKKRIPCLI